MISIRRFRETQNGRVEDLPLPPGAHPPAAMNSLLTTPSPGEELMTTPILQTTETLSPEVEEASTALIADPTRESSCLYVPETSCSCFGGSGCFSKEGMCFVFCGVLLECR
ncbi:PREDICTED: small cell adhesion glycoprotein isoform X2 [Dipodomys ordii]|uniref:Small cell adhesion glycoprotein isoform X2 n=1 Tax=Dipodomys ordii TaxID=10020 RepID=A0A1S3FD98_DIPOR|nr:PREDICTED: small cell adhesion glycoprotein isoform X2 [Dipodomys ordii]